MRVKAMAYVKTKAPAQEAITNDTVRPNKNGIYPILLINQAGSMPVRLSSKTGKAGDTFFLDGTVAQRSNVELEQFYLVQFELSSESSTYTNRNGEERTGRSWQVAEITKVESFEVFQAASKVPVDNFVTDNVSMEATVGSDETAMP